MDRFLAGSALVLIGFAIVFLAMVLLILSAGGEVRGFGFILIGPIPLIISGGAETIYIAIGVFTALLSAIVAAMLSSRSGRALAEG